MRFALANDLIRQRAIEAVKSAKEGHVVSIGPPKRSNSQNAFHWKRLDIIRMHIADATGQIFTSEELHEFFKKKFLPAKVVEVGGEVERVYQTSHDKDSKEFAEFMDAIDRYCIETMGLYLPIPGEE